MYRYPCANVFYNGTWFYGTYTLRKGPCVNSNWPIQGPFVGFRTSSDHGQTWIDPYKDMTDPKLGPDPYSNNVFREAAPPKPTPSCHNNTKVKFGAPNSIDFGTELEHSPDGKLYLIGHGNTDLTSYESWMQGDSIYVARVPPTVDAVNDGSRYEFWSGSAAGWTSGNVSRAQPVFTWPNRTGSVTMTYVPAIERYFMCVCTLSVSPLTSAPFDTYFLESQSITGPFNYIAYLPKFGIQAYFVAMPSKWLAAAVNATDGSLDVYINYSADWSMHGDHGNPVHPPANWGNWQVQHMRLSKSTSAAA